MYWETYICIYIPILFVHKYVRTYTRIVYVWIQVCVYLRGFNYCWVMFLLLLFKSNACREYLQYFLSNLPHFECRCCCCNTLQRCIVNCIKCVDAPKTGLTCTCIAWNCVCVCASKACMGIPGIDNYLQVKSALWMNRNLNHTPSQLQPQQQQQHTVGFLQLEATVVFAIYVVYQQLYCQLRLCLPQKLDFIFIEGLVPLWNSYSFTKNKRKTSVTLSIISP